MTRKIESHAAELLELLEGNPGLLMNYADWANELGWEIPTVQNAYRWLCQHYDGGNLVVPAPYNGYVAGLQLAPGAETFDGVANQERHLRTRTATQRHRVGVAINTSSDRIDKKLLRNYDAGLDAVAQLTQAMAGMLQAAAEKKRQA